MLLKFPVLRQLLTGSEPLLAAIATALVGIYDIYKKDSWAGAAQLDVVWPAACLLAVVGLYFEVKALTQWIKDQSDTHKAEKEKLQAELAEVRKFRDTLARIIDLMGEIVERKLHRLREVKRGKGGQKELWEALNPQHQIQVGMTALHAFMSRSLNSGEALRLAVYLPVNGCLKSMFSWNGKTESCLSGQSEEYMRIDEPKGARSVITNLYHSPKSCVIYEDCEAAAKAGTSIFLRPEQQGYLKSMIAIKHPVQIDGEAKVVFLAMDTNVAGFFKQSDVEWIEKCCAEFLKRLELELLCLFIRGDSLASAHSCSELPKPSSP